MEISNKETINRFVKFIMNNRIHILIVFLWLLLFVQQERIISAIEEAAYYQPLDVNVVNTPYVKMWD